MPPAPTVTTGPTSSVHLRPTSSSRPSAGEYGTNSLIVYPTTPRVPSDAAMREIAPVTASTVLSTMATPPTSLLCRICGEMTLTTAFWPGSLPSRSAPTSAAPVDEQMGRRGQAERVQQLEPFRLEQDVAPVALGAVEDRVDGLEVHGMPPVSGTPRHGPRGAP